jgi:hypothetical protein
MGSEVVTVVDSFAGRRRALLRIYQVPRVPAIYIIFGFFGYVWIVWPVRSVKLITTGRCGVIPARREKNQYSWSHGN